MTTLGNQFLYRDVGHIRRNLPMPTREAFAGMLGIDDIAKPHARRDLDRYPTPSEEHEFDRARRATRHGS